MVMRINDQDCQHIFPERCLLPASASAIIFTLQMFVLFLIHPANLLAQTPNRSMNQESSEVDVSDTLDPMKYYYDFEFRGPEAHAYAQELTRFAERLQHDEATFKADLSAKLDELRISLQISPDGMLKVYSWHDGDEGSAMNYHSIYQTYRDGRFRAVFMEDYYYEPRAVYQMETTDGPVYLIQYFSRESGWSYAIGMDAFTIDDDGRLKPVDIFERIPELYKSAEGYAASLAVECSPVPPSLYLEGAWVNKFFSTITEKDVYMPHYAKSEEPNTADGMTDFYHRFEWLSDNRWMVESCYFTNQYKRELIEGKWYLQEVQIQENEDYIDGVVYDKDKCIVFYSATNEETIEEPVLDEDMIDSNSSDNSAVDSVEWNNLVRELSMLSGVDYEILNDTILVMSYPQGYAETVYVKETYEIKKLTKDVLVLAADNTPQGYMIFVYGRKEQPIKYSKHNFIK